MENNLLNRENSDTLPQLCPIKSSIAFCLNQLRQAQITFLNLGNIIICPEQSLILIFKAKSLMQIEYIRKTS